MVVAISLLWLFWNQLETTFIRHLKTWCRKDSQWGWRRWRNAPRIENWKWVASWRQWETRNRCPGNERKTASRKRAGQLCLALLRSHPWSLSPSAYWGKCQEHVSQERWDTGWMGKHESKESGASLKWENSSQWKRSNRGETGDRSG